MLSYTQVISCHTTRIFDKAAKCSVFFDLHPCPHTSVWTRLTEMHKETAAAIFALFWKEL